MTAPQLREVLLALDLSQVQAAQLLGADARTVRRWVAEDAACVPRPAEAALRAWVRLNRAGLAWRPDEVPLEAADADDVVGSRPTRALELEAALERVRSRGGPAAPWDVDLARGRATLGAFRMSFQVLADGVIAAQSYQRHDGVEADLARDRGLLEDALACVARALERSGVGPASARASLALAPARHVLGVPGERFVLWPASSPPLLVVIVPGEVARAVFGAAASLKELTEQLDAIRPALARHAQRVLTQPALAEPPGGMGALGVVEIWLTEASLRRTQGAAATASTDAIATPVTVPAAPGHAAAVTPDSPAEPASFTQATA
jgi:hypothetical protein